jgi:hypothetical protein
MAHFSRRCQYFASPGDTRYDRGDRPERVDSGRESTPSGTIISSLVRFL